MGAQLTMPQKSLAVVGCVLFVYIIGVIVYVVQNLKTPTSPSTNPPTFTPSPTNPPIFTPLPTISPTTSPQTEPPIPTDTSPPHLEFNDNALEGPPGFTDNFYRLGCQAALSEGLFPFSNFNTTGTFKSGILCDYYNYDTWGFGGDTDQLNCGGNCITGVKTTCSSTTPPASPNQAWTDEQCGICATASKDPNCIWTKTSDSCYRTLTRVDFVDGKWVDNNVTFVPSYHGMDISQCYYKAQGELNDHKLCCDPSVA
jgi:hypothetical protein